MIRGFISGSPEDYLMWPFDDLFEALPDDGQWTQRDLQMLDYLYRERIRRAFTQGTTEDELATLQDHIARVATRAEHAESVPAQWSQRWRFAVDLLDRQLVALATRPRRDVLKRAHVSDILQLITDSPGIGQRDVGETLQLKKANLTRLLNFMEAHELVRRKSQGRENKLFPGTRAPQTEVTDVIQSSTPQKRRIFSPPLSEREPPPRSWMEIPRDRPRQTCRLPSDNFVIRRSSASAA